MSGIFSLQPMLGQKIELTPISGPMAVKTKGFPAEIEIEAVKVQTIIGFHVSWTFIANLLNEIN